MNNVCKHLKEEKRKADLRFHDDYVDANYAGSNSASPLASPSESISSPSSANGSRARNERFY